jgi:hypothetical protein
MPMLVLGAGLYAAFTIHKTATTGLPEDIADIMTAVAVLLTVLCKMGPLQKDHTLLVSHILLACANLTAEAMQEEERAAEHSSSCRIMITTAAAVFKD